MKLSQLIVVAKSAKVTKSGPGGSKAMDPATYDPEMKKWPKVVMPLDLYKSLCGSMMGKVPMGFNIEIAKGLALLLKHAATWMDKSGSTKKIKADIAKGYTNLVVVPEDAVVPGYEGRPWPDIFTEIHEMGHSLWFRLPADYRQGLEAAYFEHFEPHMAHIYTKRGYAAFKRPGEFFADTYAAYKFDKALWNKWLAKSKDDLIHMLDKLTKTLHKPVHVEYRALGKVSLGKKAAPHPNLPTVKPVANPGSPSATSGPAPAGHAPQAPADASTWKKRLLKIVGGLDAGKTPEELADYMLANLNLARKDLTWEPAGLAITGPGNADVWKKRLVAMLGKPGHTSEQKVDYMLARLEFGRKNYSWEPTDLGAKPAKGGKPAPKGAKPNPKVVKKAAVPPGTALGAKLTQLAKKHQGKLKWESPSGKKWYYNFPCIDDADDFAVAASKVADLSFVITDKRVELTLKG